MDTTAKEAATRLLVGLGLKGDDLAAATDAVTRTRIKAPSDVFVPSPFKVTELITAVNTTALALCDLISRQRIGRSQELEVDAEHATGTLTTHFSYIIDGLTAPESVAVLAEHIGYSDPLRLWKGIMNNTWKLKDGKYIVFFMRPADTPAKLASALGFTDSEIDQLVPLLDTVSGRAEFARQTAAKIESWDSAALEARIIKLNATAAIVGLPESEFKASDHGKLAQTWPMVEIIAEPGSWKPTPWTRILNPLHGILHGVKVLELTRVLLGPRGGCLLSALGATVVRVNSPLIEEGFVAVDVNIGKRSVHLDMKDDADREKFAGLMRECDVFISKWVCEASAPLVFD
jgi:crotonobetainyl-CoA:carnitine CoA-transferase CaiB-like acyl-CoA transferase